MKTLFQPVAGHLYNAFGKKRGADKVFIPAFERIFLQLSAFYLNGMQGDILEFGVLQGYTANIIAECMKRFRIKKARLHLFDSFEGLPEGDEQDKRSYELINGIWSKGSMAVAHGIDRLIEKKLRKRLGDERLFVVKGYFEETLERHIWEKKIMHASLINLDCDLYSSSKFVLSTLFERKIIQDGTLLICDDWMMSFGNPNLGQRKAVHDVLARYPQWMFEPLFNYGIGSHVFIAHDLSLSQGVKK